MTSKTWPIHKVIKILFFLNLLSITFGRIPKSIPIGPITTQFDVLIAVLLLIALFFYRLFQRELFIFNKKLFIALFVYFFIGLISVVFSQDISQSLVFWLAHVTFASIFYLTILPVQNQSTLSQNYSFIIPYRTLVHYLFIAVIISSVTAILVNMYTHYQGTGTLGFMSGRFAFNPYLGAPFDIIFPEWNTASHINFGTGIALIICLYKLNLNKSLRWNSLILLSLLLPLIVIFTSASRSGIVGLLLSSLVVLPSFIKLLKSKSINLKKYVWIPIVLALILLFLLIFVIPPIWISRILGRSLVESSNSSRIELIQSALLNITSSFKNFIIGIGFKLGAPHNEFLSALLGSGIFGFFSYIYLIVVIYQLAFKGLPLSKKMLISKMLFWFIMVIISFSGLTKLFWTVMIFILFPSIENQYSKLKNVPNNSQNV